MTAGCQLFIEMKERVSEIMENHQFAACSLSDWPWEFGAECGTNENNYLCNRKVKCNKNRRGEDWRQKSGGVTLLPQVNTSKKHPNVLDSVSTFFVTGHSVADQV